MALVNPLGPLLFWPGFSNGDSGLALATYRTLDAAGEYDGYVIQAREDMTISHVGNYVTATGSPTMDVRIETVDTGTGFPSGTLWGTNTNKVTATLTTGFTLHALTAAASISRAQIFAVRFNYNSGTSVITRHAAVLFSGGASLPYQTFNVGTPTRGQLTAYVIVGLGSSASTFYSVYGLLPINAVTITSFNNTSSAKRGARFQVPFRCRCCGLRAVQVNAAGSFNAVIMNDSGAELSSSSTLSVNVQKAGSVGSSVTITFDNPVPLYPGVWYRAVLEPTTTTAVRVDYATLPNADYRAAWPGGMNFYLAEFSGSTWTDSTDKVPIIDLMLDQISGGSGSPPTYVAGVVA